jgi:serine phosphatase RsbU (regulator of sigma subunit)/tetratricopeptide (TPR) repeat protein
MWMCKRLLLIGLLLRALAAQAQQDSTAWYQQAATWAQRQGQPQQALQHYLKVAFWQENAKDELSLANTYQAIGQLYQAQQVPQKALDYWRKAHQLRQKLGAGLPYAARLASLRDVGLGYWLVQDLPQAEQYYKQALELAKQQPDYVATSDLLGRLFAVAQAGRQPERARAYAQEGLALAEKRRDQPAMIGLLNNLGFFYREQNDLARANEHFRRALDLSQQLARRSNDEERAVILQNMGVIYTNLSDSKNALASLQEALKIRQKLGDKAKIAESINYLAMHHLVEEYYDGAEKEAQGAVALAQPNRDFRNLIESYKILAEVGRKQGEYRRADGYVRLREAAQDSLAAQRERRGQLAQQQQIAAERQESEFRLLLSEKQKQELLLRQLKLEADQREQELELNRQQLASLAKDKQLQTVEAQRLQAEKIQAQQALEVSRQRLLAEAQAQKLTGLEKEQALQALALAQQQRKTEAAELAKTKSEASNQLAEQARARERQRANFLIWGGTGVLALVLAILALVVRNARQRRRDNEKLAQQAKVINDTNEELKASEEELKQNLEELSTTQEQLRLKFDELAHTNRNVAASIASGKRIQEAMLPHQAEVEALFPQSFVLLKPRDVVSGDFYWCAQAGPKRILVAADCTGHGIPGAFMSLLGLSTLHQLVFTQGITSPELLLAELGAAIQKSLRQKENQTREGMDIAVCVVDQERKLLEFAGAHRPLLYIQNGTVHEERGDRLFVGGSDQAQAFTKHTVRLDQPTTFYLFTDGYPDQFGREGKKLGSKSFKELLVSIHQQPLAAQKEFLGQYFDQWRGPEKQIDDVLVMGVMVE